jgi:hypothetical protein
MLFSGMLNELWGYMHECYFIINLEVLYVQIITRASVVRGGFVFHQFSYISRHNHLIENRESCCRLFDLSSDLEKPEQEFYLQPIVPGKCQNASAICPVEFSYGSDHLWDRFSVCLLNKAPCILIPQKKNWLLVSSNMNDLLYVMIDNICFCEGKSKNRFLIKIILVN